MTLAPASCCCDQEPVGPCAPQESYAPITICLKDSAGSHWQYQNGWIGGCDCNVTSLNDCPTPSGTAPSYGAGCSIQVDWHECDCPIAGGTCTTQSIAAMRSMNACWALPYVSQGSYNSSGYYIRPSGEPTTLFCLTAGILIEWAVPPAERFSFDRIDYGTCDQCTQYTLLQDPDGVPVPYKARFYGPPYITTAPAVWTIRRQTTGSVAHTWEITSTAFIIRNSSGTIVYTINLAGQTIDTLFTAIDTQTAAPVILVKQYGTAGAYSADLLPATELEPRAASAAFIGTQTQFVRLFPLASGQQRRVSLPTVTPPDTINGIPNPWAAMKWSMFTYTSPAIPDAPYTQPTYAMFAADVGYSEATVAAFCEGFAQSWDWTWIQDYAETQCNNWTPGENPPGSPGLGTYVRNSAGSCNGCPEDVVTTSQCAGGSPFAGYPYTDDLSPMKQYYVLGSEGNGYVTSADMCLQQYGGGRDYWVCDPFESEADCCCPEVNGDNCSEAFRLFSACYEETSSRGQWAEYLFSVSR